MPTFTHGKSVTVLMNGNDLSEYFSSATSSGSADTAEVSTFGSTSKSYIAGQKDATISVEGFYSGAAGAVDEYLASKVGADAVWTVVFSTDALGARGYGATTIATTYEVGAEIGGAVAVSAEGQATVGQEPVTVLHPLGEETSSASGTQVDNTTSTANGAACYLHVTAVSGTTPTLVAKVQHSSDGTTWVDVATFASVSTAGSSERVATTGTVNRYLRAEWTVGGTSPAFTFHLSAARL